ncbi:putative polysaccharide biosynthesis protein [Aquibacillus sediminis]|uniref:putative polysaccharide biosynthesis protein n=1 Tax=Aquibacillus sediminis TaxID=2574734 RepID=UPI001108A4F8|nr:polysaccharide biosynthesis protein [Aquibacillus sediminis]
MATSNIVRGTMLLTAGIFISKFLGMIYVIPFEWLVGETGTALFSYAYTPYNIILSISTVGVPLAVSKFVAKYNSLGDYQTGRRIFKNGLSLMMITGVISFLVLFFSAGFIAKLTLVEGSTGNSVEDATMVIRMVSFALLIIPSMSIARGFFQGYQSMGPTAVSQVVEQIARIIFLLISAYLIVRVFEGSIPLAVGFATFATFIGAIASSIVLYVYWKKRKPYLDSKLQEQERSYDLPLKGLFKELFHYAGPFILVGIATSLYQIIDQFTLIRTMTSIGYTQEFAEISYTSFNYLGHKLVIIPVTLATGLSLAMLPAITKSFTENKQVQMFKQMNQAFQIIILFVVPAVVGLSLLANEAYGSLYGLETIDISGPLLAWYAPVGLFFAFFTVSSSVLQGIERQQFAVISLSAGLIIKLVCNIPFIHLFGAKGAIFATILAVATVVSLNLWKIKRSVDFSFHQIFKRTMLVGIFVTIMGCVVWLAKWFLGFSIVYTDGRMESIIILAIGVILGASVYLWLSYESTLLERVLGNRIRILDKFFKRKRE